MFFHTLIPIVRSVVAKVARFIQKVIRRYRFWYNQWLSEIMERARQRALMIVRDHDDADEAVALVMFRIVRQADFPERFEAYVLCAVRNAALDILRRRARHQATLVDAIAVDEEPEDNSPLASEQVVTTQEASLLHTALDKLKPVERDAVELHYFQELSIPDTASRVGVDLYTVQNKLVRARRKLERTLRPQLA